MVSSQDDKSIGFLKCRTASNTALVKRKARAAGRVRLRDFQFKYMPK